VSPSFVAAITMRPARFQSRLLLTVGNSGVPLDEVRLEPQTAHTPIRSRPPATNRTDIRGARVAVRAPRSRRHRSGRPVELSHRQAATQDRPQARTNATMRSFNRATVLIGPAGGLIADAAGFRFALWIAAAAMATAALALAASPFRHP
jgi:hypothetical protein